MTMTSRDIYANYGDSPLAERVAALWQVVEQLRLVTPPDLVKQLADAVSDLEKACQAVVPVSRPPQKKAGLYKGAKGYGINAAKKAIACDTAMSILKQIKAVRGW
jgi:hypothetical protein